MNAIQSASVSQPALEHDLAHLLQDIRARGLAGEFDAQACISPDVIAQFKRIGVYRALVPKRFGGEEWTPMQFCELIERLSQADGSAGWVASFGMSPAYLAALPEATLRQLYAAGPDVVFAGGIFPPQPAESVVGGYRVSGRWQFSSGCQSADVVGVGISPLKADNSLGLPHMAVLPRASVAIEETWDTIGLKGTGSHDLVVDDVFVAEEWTMVRGAPSMLPEPFFRYPALSFATQVLSVVALGVARAAIDELVAMGNGSRSITGGPSIGQRPLTQFNVAQAEADWRAARSWFYDAMNAAWDSILSGDAVSLEQINALRLSSTHATRVAAKVSRDIQLMSGMAGIYRNHPLSRYVNDTNVITQHAFMGDLTYQNAGAMLFGHAPLGGYL
ncbi:MAG: hypothetical protein KA214_02640 [Neisseriaceae bacterium]|nr:hypothetical protein [Neisseriaceae bacterium]